MNPMFKGLPDMVRLRACDFMHADKLESISSLRAKRMDFIARIHGCAQDGKVCVVWSGRDCDGVRYSGDVRTVDATVAAVQEHIEHTLAWADGPCSWQIVRPSDKAVIHYESRDLTLEAFEDGHSHVIYA